MYIMSDIHLTPGQNIKPNLNKKTVEKLIERLYGLKVKQIKQLDAYDDKNYHVICDNIFENVHIQKIETEGYVLKVINSLDSRNVDLIEAQTELLLFLNQQGIKCPVPVKQKSGFYYSLEFLETEHLGSNENYVAQKHAVRLLVFKPGVLLSKVAVSEELIAKVGRQAVKLDQVLAGFSHPAYECHSSIWNLEAVPKLRDFVHALDDQDNKDLVNKVIDEFEDKVCGQIETFERSLIHGDLNEQNIIVDSKGQEIEAIIDFNDAQKSCLVFEVAICMCYIMMWAEDVKAGKWFLKGYQEGRILTNGEKAVLKLCVSARLCQSLVLGAHSHKQDSQNEYLLITQKPGWKILKELWPMNNDEVYSIWLLQ